MFETYTHPLCGNKVQHRHTFRFSHTHTETHLLGYITPWVELMGGFCSLLDLKQWEGCKCRGIEGEEKGEGEEGG